MQLMKKVNSSDKNVRWIQCEAKDKLCCMVTTNNKNKWGHERIKDWEVERKKGRTNIKKESKKGSRERD